MYIIHYEYINFETLKKLFRILWVKNPYPEKARQFVNNKLAEGLGGSKATPSAKQPPSQIFDLLEAAPSPPGLEASPPYSPSQIKDLLTP